MKKPPPTRNAPPKSHNEKPRSSNSGKSVKFGSTDILDFIRKASPNEVGITKRSEGGISSSPIFTKTQFTQTPLTETEEGKSVIFATNRAQASAASKKAKEESRIARNVARNITPRNPNSPPDTRKEQVVNKQSQFGIFATQLTGGAPTQIKNATGELMDEVVGGVESFFSNLLQSGNLLSTGKSLPTGPEQAQKPQSVSGPNGTGNGNRKPPEKQAQGPRSESWVDRTSGITGGRGR
jgi:hypothetical protein